MADEQTGTVVALHIAGSASQPMQTVTQLEAVAGEGIVGDRYRDKTGTYSDRPQPGRHITLIEEEMLQMLLDEHGISFAPEESRRNVTTRGIHLNDLVGKTFQIGTVRCQAIRLCDPCNYLQELTGKPVLRPLVDRGGLRADVIAGGIIRVGDQIVVA
ncbi:MAG: MOSC domain-containing protein [Chloroflexaceae bacterium]|nr:MOSC domain-containing protein [Chloroflexaceae bacterium]